LNTSATLNTLQVSTWRTTRVTRRTRGRRRCTVIGLRNGRIGFFGRANEGMPSVPSVSVNSGIATGTSTGSVVVAVSEGTRTDGTSAVPASWRRRTLRGRRALRAPCWAPPPATAPTCESTRCRCHCCHCRSSGARSSPPAPARWAAAATASAPHRGWGCRPTRPRHRRTGARRAWVLRWAAYDCACEPQRPFSQHRGPTATWHRCCRSQWCPWRRDYEWGPRSHGGGRWAGPHATWRYRERARRCAARWGVRRCPRGECRQPGHVRGRASPGRWPAPPPHAPWPVR
jgi:hypothetical protein